MATTKPLHPGEVLSTEFLKPLALTQITFSKHLSWTYARLNEIINLKRGVTADSALAFSESLKTTPEYWLDLQRDWDLWHAKQNHKKIEPLPNSPAKTK